MRAEARENAVGCGAGILALVRNKLKIRMQ